VKLFPVSRKNMRTVGDLDPTSWIVGSLGATSWTPRNSKDGHEANAKSTNQAKASRAVKAGSASKHKVKAKLIRAKAVRQKKQRHLARDEEEVTDHKYKRVRVSQTMRVESQMERKRMVQERIMQRERCGERCAKRQHQQFDPR
jgi:hypothetical protein